MYKEFAETAREEGFDEIAEFMEEVAEVEEEHEKGSGSYWKGCRMTQYSSAVRLSDGVAGTVVMCMKVLRHRKCVRPVHTRSLSMNRLQKTTNPNRFVIWLPEETRAAKCC